MFGFVIGTLCLIGLIKVVRYSRHGWHGHHGGGRAARRRWMLRWAFSRLSTTPSQEKVILDAADSIDAEREKLWAELEATKADLAAAIKSEAFDEAKFRAAFERQQTLLAALQESVLGNARTVFDALQPDQRKQVADALEHGARASMGCGGYRHHGYAHC